MNKKRTSFGLAVAVVAVLGLVGAGTFALFSDQYVQEDNTVAAGTVEIRVTAGGAQELSPSSISGTNQAPRPAYSEHQGDIDSIDWTGTTQPNRVDQKIYRISNVGTITATASFTIDNLQSEDQDGNADPTMQEHIYLTLLPVAIGLCRQLRLLQLGNDLAAVLGLRVDRARAALLCTAAALAAMATAVAGVGCPVVVCPSAVAANSMTTDGASTYVIVETRIGPM
jgi:predicted ribosomally synthesized peptide with SipW-like signal peptide